MGSSFKILALMALALGSASINAAPSPAQINVESKNANTNTPRDALIAPQGRPTKPFMGNVIWSKGLHKRFQNHGLSGDSDLWTSEDKILENDLDIVPSDKGKRQVPPCSVPGQWGNPRQPPPGGEDCPKGRFDADGDDADAPKVAQEFAA